MAELIEPTVKGTLNVLRSCSKAPSVRRVVLTSSIAAVSVSRNTKGLDVLLDETWFSDPIFCEESNGIAFQKLWQRKLQENLPKKRALTWKRVFEFYEMVDIRDVAYSHVLAFENPSASGRYCLVETVITRFEALEILHKLYPSFNLPKIDPGEPMYRVSKKQAESLGVVFTPVEVGLKDTVESLNEKKLFT